MPIRTIRNTFKSPDILIQHSVLSFTGHSKQCDMTDSEHPSWRPLAINEVNKVIFTVCGDSKKYDKNNSDLLARAIHLKPQNLSHPKSWLVVVEFFVCLFVCGKHYMVVRCWCHSVTVTLFISLAYLTMLMSIYRSNSVNFTMLISLWCIRSLAMVGYATQPILGANSVKVLIYQLALLYKR